MRKGYIIAQVAHVIVLWGLSLDQGTFHEVIKEADPVFRIII